jgi:hypothetical protein
MSNDVLNKIIKDIETRIDSVDVTPEIENV